MQTVNSGIGPFIIRKGEGKYLAQHVPKEPARTGYAHIAFSTGSREAVDALTARLKADGYEFTSGPRITGDGYYESCIAAVEGNLIELTV